MGLEASTRFSICVSASAPQTVAKYLMAYLAETVFPAPDSPDTIMDWFSSNLKFKQNAKIFMMKKSRRYTKLSQRHW